MIISNVDLFISLQKKKNKKHVDQKVLLVNKTNNIYFDQVTSMITE